MAAAESHLLFGLIALQVGLIDQSQLVAAFQAWVRDKARPLADHLAACGDLDADARAAVEAMVALQLKKHGGDPERSLAAVPAGHSTRERLAALGDPELTARSPGSGPARPSPSASPTASGRRPTPSAPRRARASGSACSVPTRAAGWAPSSWPWTTSCTARSR